MESVSSDKVQTPKRIIKVIKILKDLELKLLLFV